VSRPWTRGRGHETGRSASRPKLLRQVRLLDGGRGAWTDSGVQGGPVDELFDVAVERPAFDQLEGPKSGRSLEDRVITGPTCDHRGRVSPGPRFDQGRRPSAARFIDRLPLRAQRHLGLLLEPGDGRRTARPPLMTVPRPASRVVHPGWSTPPSAGQAPHPGDPWVTHLGLLGTLGQPSARTPDTCWPPKDPSAASRCTGRGGWLRGARGLALPQ